MIFSNPTAIAHANTIAIHANSVKAVSDHIFYAGSQATPEEIQAGYDEIIKSCTAIAPVVHDLLNYVRLLQNTKSVPAVGAVVVGDMETPIH